jgi:hypothetical protein
MRGTSVPELDAIRLPAARKTILFASSGKHPRNIATIIAIEMAYRNAGRKRPSARSIGKAR